jgi:hypothetical protein
LTRAADFAAIRPPGTPLRIERIRAGPRVGEWLLASGSVTAAPRFLVDIIDKPLRSHLGRQNW